MDVTSELLARMDRLERRCEAIEVRLAIRPRPTEPEPEPAHVWSPPVEAPETAPAPPDAPASLESRVGLAWLNRIGVITLILGVGFAFKTAVENDWIGPVGRVAVGVVAGLLALLAGERLRRRQRVFAQGLTGLGIGLLYLSWWAAFALYQLVPQEAAFGLMIATTAASAWLALRYDVQAIALLAMIGGYVTPVVLATGDTHALVFLAYVALVNAGGHALARHRGWRGVEILAAVATIALFGGWLASTALPGDRALATAFLLVYDAQFAAARTAGLWQLAQPLASLAIAASWPHDQVMPLLLVVAAGGLAVAHLRDRAEAPLVAGVWFWLAYGVWVGVRGGDASLAGVTAGFALFVGWIVARVVHGRVRAAEVVLLGANSLAYFAAAYAVLRPDHAAFEGGFTVALAIAHLAFARLAWRTGHAGRLALLLGLALFTLAVPIQLAGATMTVAWALEATCLAYLARRFGSERLGQAALAVLALTMIVLVADVDALGTDLVAFANPRGLAFATTAAAAFALSRLLRTSTLRAAALAPVAYLAGHVVALVGLGYELHAWTSPLDHRGNAFTVALTIAMALYAAMLVVLGVVRRSVLDRVLGLGLLGLVVAKLYVLDVWELGRPFRIAAFLGLGMLLLGVSYVYSRYRTTIERLWK